MTVQVATNNTALLERAAAAGLRTPAGRLAMAVLATVMIGGLRMPFWWAIGIFLALTSLFPADRKKIALLAAICWVFLAPPLDIAVLRELAPARAADAWLRPAPVAVPLLGELDFTSLALLLVSVSAAFALAFAYLSIIRRFPASPPARKPVMWLILLLLALFASTQAPLRGLPWLILAATVMVFNQYIWFFAYWASENRAADLRSSALKTYAWRPFWGFTAVPFGRGAAYLERVEAKNDEQLAESQWKGLKLLALAVFWTAVFIVIKRALYGQSESLTSIPRIAPHGTIPTYQMALDAMSAGHPYPLAMRWAALGGYFVMWVLYFTIFGHKIVAICRLAGFNAFRNTYKPHLATSIAEFYNRIYYYFKELLVAFFFYPTYLRHFKKFPRLRLFAATLVAAGFGNFFFHYLRADEHILRYGLWKTLIFYFPYVIYALVLGGAIGISQLRVVARKGKQPAGARRILAIAGVWLFFCLICIIEEPNDTHGLVDYGHYFVSLYVP